MIPIVTGKNKTKHSSSSFLRRGFTFTPPQAESAMSAVGYTLRPIEVLYEITVKTEWYPEGLDEIRIQDVDERILQILKKRVYSYGPHLSKQKKDHSVFKEMVYIIAKYLTGGK